VNLQHRTTGSAKSSRARRPSAIAATATAIAPAAPASSGGARGSAREQRRNLTVYGVYYATRGCTTSAERRIERTCT
jgi:hypothetical protein